MKIETEGFNGGMDYIRVATLKDFEEEDIKSFSIFGKKIGVFKNDEGGLSAIEVGCKHQGADLTQGKIEHGIATCPRHHWKYDLRTGKCINHESPDLRKHSVRIEGTDVLISFQPVS